MVPCPARRVALLTMLFTFAACYTLDDVPIVEGPHCAPETTGYVVRTLDGDTIEVVTQEKVDLHLGEDTAEAVDTGESSAPDERILTVRMLGVDAPEIAHNDAEVADCYGDEAAQWTRAAVGREVVLSFDKTCTDKYSRALAYVFYTDDRESHDVTSCSDGSCTLPTDTPGQPAQLINDMIIRYGYARLYEEFSDIRLVDLLTDAQAAAQAQNIGIWSKCE